MTKNSPLLKMKIANSRGRLYRVALAWCGDPMLAEDLVHETIASSIDKCDQLRNEEKLFSWLYSILNNKWYGYLRKNKSHDDLNEKIPCEDSGPSTLCQELQLVNQVRSVVASLPVVERQVLSLVDLEDFSYCEVAKTLDIPIGTVMSRLHRARKNLLTRMDQINNEPETIKPNLHRVK
jgi:RNA polymerase sigma-70 factor, ECF subfamily